MPVQFTEHHVRPGVFYYSPKAHKERQEVKARREDAAAHFAKAQASVRVQAAVVPIAWRFSASCALRGLRRSKRMVQQRSMSWRWQWPPGLTMPRTCWRWRTALPAKGATRRGPWHSAYVWTWRVCAVSALAASV